MKNIKISLAGDLGSGKTTVGEILAKKYDLEKVSVGKIQRAMAAEMGMDTNGLNEYMKAHPELDKKLDDMLSEYEKKDGKYLFDSRMAWHFVPSSFSVYMSVDKEVAAERIKSANRADESYSSVDEALKEIAERRKNEILRYKQFYGVDIMDMNNYDFVIDTTCFTPEEVAERICEAFEKTLK